MVWLEDQKIRHYTIQDREELRDINGEQWQKALAKYLDDLGAPKLTRPLEQLEWLLGLAVRLEYEDDRKFSFTLILYRMLVHYVSQINLMRIAFNCSEKISRN